MNKIIEIQDRIDGYDVPIVAHENADNTYSIGVLNNPQGIPDTTKAFVMNRTEVPIIGDTLTPLISIRCDDVNGLIRLGTLSIASDGSKPVVFHVYRNATLVGSSFVPFGGDSYSSYDVSATSVVPSEVIGGLVLNKVDTQRVNLFTNDVFLKGGHNDVITLACISSNSSDITLFQRHLEKALT